MRQMVNWDRVEALCCCLVERVTENNYDMVVGMGRGGLIPAVVISHRLKIPMMPIMWQTRDSMYRSNLLSLPVHPKLLIVDDINDTGTALRDLLKAYNHHNVMIDTAVLYERHDSTFQADYVGERLEDSRWIVMPWEIE